MSVVILLLTTAALKILALLTAVMQAPLQDPVLSFLTHEQMMLLSVALESAVIVFLMQRRRCVSKLLVIGGLAGLFASYHVGLQLVGGHRSCGCLGESLTWFGLPSDTEWMVTSGIVGYFLVGSYLLACSETANKTSRSKSCDTE